MITNKNSSKKNGQVWTIDFLVGLTLFIIVSLITVKIAISAYPSQDNIQVYRDAVHLSDALLSQGYPINWDTNTVLLPGMGYNNRIDTTLLVKFSDLDYYRTKTLLHVDSDYIFFIHNGTNVLTGERCVYGYNITTDVNCTPLLTTIDYANLAKIDRLIIYNSSVAIMTVYTWN